MSAAGGLSGAAAGGDKLTALRALRDRLAVEIDSCDSKRDLAALAQRMLDVLAAVEAAEKAQPRAKGTPRDEVARRRAERAAASARQGGSAV